MKELLLIDGYNLLHQAEELFRREEDTLEEGRHRLIQRIQNYAGYGERPVVLVFDGAARIQEHAELHRNLEVVYTRREETADTYIERLAAVLARQGVRVTVVTSDYEEQKSIFGSGAIRQSSREFLRVLQDSKRSERAHYRDRGEQKNRLDRGLDERIRGVLEALRKSGGIEG